MIQSRKKERMVKLTVEVVDKDVYKTRISSVGSKPSSGMTSEADAGLWAEGHGESCRSSTQAQQVELPVIDWETLTIIPDLDGEARPMVDEEVICEAMGFKAAEENAAEQRDSKPIIHPIPHELQDDMREAEIDVDDKDPEEPDNDWDGITLTYLLGMCILA